MTFRWEEPPRIVHTKTAAWMEALKARPEQWALIGLYSDTQIVKWRQAHTDFEFTMREIGWEREGYGKTYARYVPPRPREKPVCYAPGCDRPAIARGLCMMHYKRVRAGKPIEIDRDGNPAGFGQYGVLDVDDNSVLCHECGERFPSLGAHLKKHGLTAAEYKTRYGLSRTTSLVSGRVRQQLSERARGNVGTPGWKRLEAARDPVMASHSRTEESFASIGRELSRSDRPVVNGRKARKVTVITCPVCAAEWCPLPGGYRNITCSKACWRTLHAWIVRSLPRRNRARDSRITEKWESGLTYPDIAEQYNVTTVRIGQIIRQALHDEPDPLTGLN